MKGCGAAVAETAYGAELSEVYDLVYRGRGKDFDAEAAVVTGVVRARRPAARTLLDVACGTGEHLRAFTASFDEVAGVELSGAMCAQARRKLPGVPVHEADMREFTLGRRFDAVTCLFSSVGYMTSAVELEAALTCLARHLAPDGVLVVDPWWFPERFIDGYVSDAVVHGGGRTVARVAQSVRQGAVVRQEAHYVVVDPAGIRHFVDVQQITLFTEAEYVRAFEAAGCTVEYLTGGDDVALSGRGLFVGRPR